MNGKALRARPEGRAFVVQREGFLRKQHIIYAAGACLLLLMLALAVYNVAAYLSAGLVFMAAVAAACELIGFVMAIVVEVAFKDKRYISAAGCGGILLACAAFNVHGGEHAWQRDEWLKADLARQAAQERLDDQRSEALAMVARAEEAIRRYDHLLPDPTTNSYRQAEARTSWEATTLADRRVRDRAQANLDALPVVAAMPAVEEPSPVVAMGFGIAEIIKALGLYFCGFGALALVGIVDAGTPSSASGTTGNGTTRKGTGGNGWRRNGETLPETVRRLRFQEFPLSYGQIEKLTGVPKGTAWKWCNAEGLALAA